MKRVSDDDSGVGRAPKRVKVDYFSALGAFKDPEEEKTVSDLFNATGGMKSGFLTCKVVVTWPPTTEHRVKLETFSLLAGRKQFVVEFSGACAESLKSAGKQFTRGQELRLSLVGAEVVKNDNHSTHTELPVVLKYVDGVALEVSAKAEEAGWTWPKFPRKTSQVQSTAPAVLENGWFDTPSNSQARALSVRKNGSDLMDIDEEPSFLLKSPSPPQKTNTLPSNTTQYIAIPASPTHLPLHNIGNSPSDSTSSKPSYASASKMAPQATKDPNPSGPSKSSRHHSSEHSYSAHASTSRFAPPKPDAANTLAAPKSPSQPSPKSSFSCSSTSPQTTDYDAPSTHLLSAVRSESVPASSENHPLQPNADGARERLTKSQRKNRNRREMEKQLKRERAKADAHPAHHPLHNIENSLSDSATSSKSSAHAFSSKIPANNHANASTSSTCASPHPSKRSFHSAPPKANGARTPAAPKPLNHPLPNPSVSSFSLLPQTTDHDASNVQPSESVLSSSENHPPQSGADGEPEVLRKSQQKNRKRREMKKQRKREMANSIVGAAATTPAADLTSGRRARVEEVIQRFSVPESKPLPSSREPKATASPQTVHQTELVAPARGTRREHRLLCEVGLKQYFDCTVEVLHGFDNGVGRPYSVDCTDFTVIAGSFQCHQKWCPPSLRDCVLRIELWDAAREVGPAIVPGEFYHLRNVRMMQSRAGYPQASMQEAKITKLERGSDNKNLRILLARREEHNTMKTDSTETNLNRVGDSPSSTILRVSGSSPNSQSTPPPQRAEAQGTVHQNDGQSSVGSVRRGSQKHRLLCEVKAREFFDCTVEVLQKHDNGYGRPYTVYITDYTAVTGGYPQRQSWCPASLADRVFKIELCKAARDVGPILVVGEIYHLRNVLMRVDGLSYVEGTMYEPKIAKVGGGSDDTNLRTLLARKQAHGH